MIPLEFDLSDASPPRHIHLMRGIARKDSSDRPTVGQSPMRYLPEDFRGPLD